MAGDVTLLTRVPFNHKIDDMHRATLHYGRIQDDLEATALKQFVTVEAEAGDSSMIRTRFKASVAFRRG